MGHIKREPKKRKRQKMIILFCALIHTQNTSPEHATFTTYTLVNYNYYLITLFSYNFYLFELLFLIKFTTPSFITFCFKCLLGEYMPLERLAQSHCNNFCV